MEAYSREEADRAEQVATFRRFTRYYLLKLQPLRDAMKGPSMHAAYMRVLRTLGEEAEGATPSWIAGHFHPVERKRMISAMRDIERILRRVRWDDIRAHSD